MSRPESGVDAQLRQLLDVVERERERRCRTLREAANAQAREIVRQAHREARARTHQDFVELREQLQQRLASARAQQQTRQRRLRQQADRAFLSAAWPPLRQALQDHWQHLADRERWVANVIDTAAAMLMDAHWLIEHPRDWPEQERSAVLEKLDREYDRRPRLTPRDEITAGVRISAAGACVDGTLDGLLARRAQIEALLLAEIRNQPGDTEQTTGPITPAS